MRNLDNKTKIWELAYDGKIEIFKNELLASPGLASVKSQVTEAFPEHQEAYKIESFQ